MRLDFASRFCWRMTGSNNKQRTTTQSKNWTTNHKSKLRTFFFFSWIFASGKYEQRTKRPRKSSLKRSEIKNLGHFFSSSEFSTFHFTLSFSVCLNKFLFQLIHENLFPQWYFNFHHRFLLFLFFSFALQFLVLLLLSRASRMNSVVYKSCHYALMDSCLKHFSFTFFYFTLFILLPLLLLLFTLQFVLSSVVQNFVYI